MMRKLIPSCWLAAAAFVLATGSASTPAAAQTTATIDAVVQARWPAILTEVAARHGVAIADQKLTAASDDEKKAIYREALVRLAQDPQLMTLARPDLSLVNEKVRDEDRHFIEQLSENHLETVVAKSVDSRSINPPAGEVAERSGFTEFLALAVNGTNFISSDDTAVSLNLSALALYSLKDPKVYSELYRYQQHAALRRLGGTVVFGAKIPEDDITGISNVPDFDKLFDVFLWDVKYRVLGDRDPRSAQWYPLTLGRGGLKTQIAAAIVSSTLVQGDVALLSQVLTEDLGTFLADLKRRIARSPQLAVKVAGTHLTKETGKNRYVGQAIFDSGLGPRADLTASVLYSIVDDISAGPEALFQLKGWTINGSITAHLAEDSIVKGRTLDWNTGTAFTIFTGKDDLPVTVKNPWKIFTTLEIPVGDAARIPFTVVFTNDPNALRKTRSFGGHVGVSYDFSALKKLFKNKP